MQTKGLQNFFFDVSRMQLEKLIQLFEFQLEHSKNAIIQQQPVFWKLYFI